ncbi:unnamed protein product, partial [Prunus brigantina]
MPACELWSSIPRLYYSSLDAGTCVNSFYSTVCCKLILLDALLSSMLGCYLRPEAILVWIAGRLCQNFGRMSRVFSKLARHRGDVGTKTGSALGLGEILGRVLSAWYQSIRFIFLRLLHFCCIVD